ncbi:hypothetical protein IPZ59_06995 [Mongoliitalea daihaiensis]|nr:hypothetical protein IPZ59_06995 [Mongoliitalea daihaiensis]
MTIEATWQAGNSLLFNGNFSQMDLADIGFAGLFGKSGYVAMAMFDYTPQNGLTTIGFGKSEAKFATDMLIGRFNRWHLNKMDNAGIDQSVIKFFNNINSPLRNTIGTGIKQALKNEGEK